MVLGVLRVLEVLCVLLRVLRQRGLLRAPRRLARVCRGLRATPQRDRVIVRALLVLLGVVLLVLLVLVLVLPLAASALAAAAVLGGADCGHVRVVLGVPLGAVLLHLPPGVLLFLLLLRLRLRRLLLLLLLGVLLVPLARPRRLLVLLPDVLLRDVLHVRPALALRLRAVVVGAGGLAPQVVGVLPPRVAAVHGAEALRRDLFDALGHRAVRVDQRHDRRGAVFADVDGAVAAGHLGLGLRQGRHDALGAALLRLRRLPPRRLLDLLHRRRVGALAQVERAVLRRAQDHAVLVGGVVAHGPAGGRL